MFLNTCSKGTICNPADSADSSAKSCRQNNAAPNVLHDIIQNTGRCTFKTVFNNYSWNQGGNSGNSMNT